MSDYLYFLSYARADRDDDVHDCIRTFSIELEQEVRSRLRRPRQGSVGFFDSNDIEPGNNWPDTLSEALRTSRVFVPIYSPTYFAKDYCGREWKIFHDRLEAYKRRNPAAKVENLIQPVLYVAPWELPTLPNHIRRIQCLYDRYPEHYRKEGLWVIFKTRGYGYKESYEKFKTALARRIVEVEDKYPLPPLDHCLDIEQTMSAFHQPGREIVSITGTSKTAESPHSVPEILVEAGIPRLGTSKTAESPRSVQFIHVAGRRDELQEIRESLEHYGDEGGWDWKPFLPVATNEVWEFTTEVALKEKLRSEHIPLHANIIRMLEEAEKAYKIFVIIVDTWTLKLTKYHTLMQPYDERDSLYSALLVPWNPHCEETQSSHFELKEGIQETFPTKSIGRGDLYKFHDSINSLNEMKKHLRRTLRVIHGQIMQRIKILQRMEIKKRPEGPQDPWPTHEGPGV